jgi:alpha-beta hydrolase superfamily lysophospholipase
MKTLLSVIFIVMLGYGLLLGYVYFFQARLIYFPNIGIGFGRAVPSDIGLDYEDVVFETTDGVRLHGWYVSADQARGVVLFFHGNAGNISHRLDSIEFFHRLGFSVFIIDYRGYGRSEGKTDEQGTYRDAEAAWRHLIEARGIDPGKIVIFGRSLGASVAAWLASRTNPAALILESAFTSAPDLGSHHYWFLPVRALTRIHYDTQSYVERVSVPILVVHSTDDEIVPIAHGRKLFSRANEPKTFVKLQGGHNDGFFISHALYTEALSEFLNVHVPGSGL